MSTPETSSKPAVGKAAFWTGIAFTILPSLMLIMSGVMKLMPNKQLEDGFNQFGLSMSLATPLGIVELAITALYLIPRTAVIGAILITGYMGGAILACLRVDQSIIMQIVMGVIVWGGIWLRDPRLRKLMPLRG